MYDASSSLRDMASTDDGSQRRTLTNLKVIIGGVAGALVGLGLLWLAARHGRGQLNETWSSILSNVGALFIATSLLSLLWELAGKRAFAQEVMSQAHVGTDIVRAGITRVTDQYLEAVEWEDLMEGSSKVDIVVAYAATWRNMHRGRLLRIASRRGARIRVFLPDPEDELTMTVLANRFNTTVEDIAAKVSQAITEFGELASDGGATVEVYVRPGDVVFSCYRFDGRAVLTLYSHTKERRTAVPTLVVRNGELWSFVHEEIDAIRGQSRMVHPADGRKQVSDEANVSGHQG
jgi:hypothetical protein